MRFALLLTLLLLVATAEAGDNALARWAEQASIHNAVQALHAGNRGVEIASLERLHAQGSTAATYNLAVACLRGLTPTGHDYDRAARLFRSIADRHPQAAYNLYVVHHNGWIANADPGRAQHWRAMAQRLGFSR